MYYHRFVILSRLALHSATGWSFLSREREEGVPVISLTDQKDTVLEVTVTNVNGDDAYEATVTVSFPPYLSYSSSRPSSSVSLFFFISYWNTNQFVCSMGIIINVIHCQGLQVKCKPNKDGSTAVCDLENPFKRDSEVREITLLALFTFSV